MGNTGLEKDSNERRVQRREKRESLSNNKREGGVQEPFSQLRPEECRVHIEVTRVGGGQKTAGSPGDAQKGGKGGPNKRDEENCEKGAVELGIVSFLWGSSAKRGPQE